MREHKTRYTYVYIQDSWFYNLSDVTRWCSWTSSCSPYLCKGRQVWFVNICCVINFDMLLLSILICYCYCYQFWNVSDEKQPSWWPTVTKLLFIIAGDFLDAQASLAPTHVRCRLVRHTFESISVSGCSSWKVEESGPQLFWGKK